MLGCGVEVCEADSIPAPFVGIEADLPAQMVFCKEDPEQAPSEPQPPNRVHVNFELDTPHDAFIGMVDHFEGKGWERIEQRTEGGILSVKFGNLETGYVLDFGVINENRAKSPIKKHRVHASVMLSQAPCLEKFGADDSVCVDNTLVRCAYGMPGEEVDCGAEKLNCAGDEYGPSACVSDLCLVTKASSRKWDPASCPAELATPK
jgi:hypothetical protein